MQIIFPPTYSIHPVCRHPAGLPFATVHQRNTKQTCRDRASKLYSGMFTELILAMHLQAIGVTGLKGSTPHAGLGLVGKGQLSE